MLAQLSKIPTKGALVMVQFTLKHWKFGLCDHTITNIIDIHVLIPSPNSLALPCRKFSLTDPFDTKLNPSTIPKIPSPHLCNYNQHNYKKTPKQGLCQQSCIVDTYWFIYLFVYVINVSGGKSKGSSRTRRSTGCYSPRQFYDFQIPTGDGKLIGAQYLRANFC